MVVMTTGSKLKELRGSRSAQDVANELGISRAALSNYELDKRRPRDDMKVKIAEFYGVDMLDLFFNHESHKTWRERER